METPSSHLPADVLSSLVKEKSWTTTDFSIHNEMFFLIKTEDVEDGENY